MPAPPRQAEHVRVGSIFGLPALLRGFGIDPLPVIAGAGIAPECFDDPERRLPFAAGGRLLAHCARLTGCAHFGLLLGQQFAPSTLGAVGALMRQGPTVGAGLQNLLHHLHLIDSGAAPLLLHLSATRVALGYAIVRQGTPGTTQIYDTAVTVTHGLLRQLCGPAWQPLEVSFAHAAPADREPYVRHFGAPLRFDAELSAVSFAPSWLAQPVAGADAARRAELQRALRAESERRFDGLVVQARRALHALVFAGNDDASAVARLFGLHERALRRRLAAEGTSLQQIRAETRYSLAAQLLRDTRLPLADIAAAMHYADETAFSRAFRGWAGVPPGRWRAAAN
jgi:AraC-like DNA-binding protein